MRGVWNHDAAVQRIGRLADRDPERRARGYLLVVDAIAERARERIELALEQAPFEGAVVVWRGDQRAADLTAAFDVLERDVEAARPAPGPLRS